jgi:hypothetical protein
LDSVKDEQLLKAVREHCKSIRLSKTRNLMLIGCDNEAIVEDPLLTSLVENP